MALVLNEEQNMLKDAAKDFCTNNTPITQLRKLRDEQNSLGFDDATWRQMVDLGWAGICIPEEYGGLGFGFTGMGVVLEECGRTLAASPLIATVGLGASCVVLGGDDEQKRSILPQVAGGEMLLALALEESPHHSPYEARQLRRKQPRASRSPGVKSLY